MFADVSLQETSGDFIPAKPESAPCTQHPAPSTLHPAWRGVGLWPWSQQPGWPQHNCPDGSPRASSLDRAQQPAGNGSPSTWKPGQPCGVALGRGAGRAGLCTHLDGPQLHLGGAALHPVAVAAAGAALHLDAGRPHQVVGVAAVDEVPGDLEHLRAGLALGDPGWLSRCRGI